MTEDNWQYLICANFSHCLIFKRSMTFQKLVLFPFSGQKRLI